MFARGRWTTAGLIVLVAAAAGCGGSSPAQHTSQQARKPRALPRCSHETAGESLISNQVTCLVPGRRPTVKVFTYLRRRVTLDGYRLSVSRHLTLRRRRGGRTLVIARVAVTATGDSPSAAALYAVAGARIDCGSRGGPYFQDLKLAARQSTRDVASSARRGPVAPGKRRLVDVVVIVPPDCHEDLRLGTALLTFAGTGVKVHGLRAIVGVFLSE
jgi:hypothetical protein